MKSANYKSKNTYTSKETLKSSYLKRTTPIVLGALDKASERYLAKQKQKQEQDKTQGR